MRPSFRPIREKDILILTRTYQRNKLADFSSRFTPHAYTAHGAIKSKLHQWLAIQHKGTLIGSLWVEKAKPSSKTGKLGILIHYKKFWSRGIGRYAILMNLPFFRRRLSLSRIHLNVRCKNKRAINCYLKCGFRTIRKNTKSIQNINISYFTMQHDGIGRGPSPV